MPKSGIPRSGKYTPEMYLARVQSLMILIGGGKPAHGERDRFIQRIHDATDIGVSSLEAAWKGKWISKNRYISDNTREKLEAAAEHAKRTEHMADIARVQIDIWETAPELFQPHIDLTREYIARLRQCDAEMEQDRRRMAVSDEFEDTAITAPAPAR